MNDHDVPETRAEPAREPLRKMERRSPLARGAEREPESVGVLSLLKAPSSIGPWMLPTLSVMELIVALCWGAIVSRISARLALTAPRLPATSTTLALSA